jgi:hypothetical protein
MHNAFQANSTMLTTQSHRLQGFVLFLWSVLSSSAFSERPKSTELEATLDITEPFRDGVSQLWSPTGQAAWDALRDYHKVQAIEMNPRSPTAEKLNAFQWDKSSVLPEGTVIFSGDDSEAFREKIRAELRRKVGEPAAAMIGPYKPPGVVTREPLTLRVKSALMVSAMACKPRFPCDFMPDPSPKLFSTRNGSQFRVLGFGSTEKMSAQFGDAVRVLEDNLAGASSLRFSFFTDNKIRECLVLTTGLGQKSFEGTLTHVRELLQQGRTPERVIELSGKKWRYLDTMQQGDVLWVPHLHATLCCDYLDLIGKEYLKKPSSERPGWYDWWELGEVTQLLNVALDHKGALLQSTFKVSPNFMTSAGGAPSSRQAQIQTEPPLPIYPKSFVFDKPFMASLWREGADWPYLAFWVDGPEMLTLAK